jgi:hypothetical protein
MVDKPGPKKLISKKFRHGEAGTESFYSLSEIAFIKLSLGFINLIFQG